MKRTDQYFLFNTLNVRRSSITLKSLTGSYVDDCLNADTGEFEKSAEITVTKFDSNPMVYNNFGFQGTQVATIDKG